MGKESGFCESLAVGMFCDMGGYMTLVDETWRRCVVSVGVCLFSLLRRRGRRKGRVPG